MEIDQNQVYVITYTLKELGKDVVTEASKDFTIGDHVTYKQLEKYSADKGMITELEIAKGLLRKRISLRDYHNRLHLTALEYYKEQLR